MRATAPPLSGEDGRFPVGTHDFKPGIADEAAPAPLGQRHCGRCQNAFPGDPSLFFQTDWALCPACSTILLPDRPER